MADDQTQTFADGDRITHKIKGMGTVKADPAGEDLVLSHKEASKSGPDLVYVVWDDDRFPVGKVPASELEELPANAAAMSSGY